MSNFPPFLLQKKKKKNPNESFLVTDDVSVIFFFFVHNSMLIVGVFFCLVEKKRDFTEILIWSFFIQFERVLIHSFKSNQSGIIVIARERKTPNKQTSFDDAILI